MEVCRLGGGRSLDPGEGQARDRGEDPVGGQDLTVTRGLQGDTDTCQGSEFYPQLSWAQEAPSLGAVGAEPTLSHSPPGSTFMGSPLLVWGAWTCFSPTEHGEGEGSAAGTEIPAVGGVKGRGSGWAWPNQRGLNKRGSGGQRETRFLALNLQLQVRQISRELGLEPSLRGGPAPAEPMPAALGDPEQRAPSAGPGPLTHRTAEKTSVGSLKPAVTCFGQR